MTRVLIVEASARTTFDEATAEMFDNLTPEERAERLADMEREVTRMFVRESEDGTEVSVTVRIEEVSE